MLSIDKNSFKRDYENKFVQLHGKELKEGTNQQKYEALGSLVKDYVTNMWIETNKEYKEEELNSDELYNQNVAVYNMIVDMKKYIADAKRMNKAKMIDMLNEMLNQIDNY